MRYLDSSAFVKLAVDEQESEALRDYLGDSDDWVSSAILITEALRAAARHGEDRAEVARALLVSVRTVVVDEEILSAAAGIEPTTLRTLDAIHIATALTLGDELAALVTYDRRMQEAATVLGMEFAAPA